IPTATSAIYTLSLHDALPILHHGMSALLDVACRWATGAPVHLPTAASSRLAVSQALHLAATFAARVCNLHTAQAILAAEKVFHLDRKSTRLNSSHVKISYAVF